MERRTRKKTMSKIAENKCFFNLKVEEGKSENVQIALMFVIHTLYFILIPIHVSFGGPMHTKFLTYGAFNHNQVYCGFHGISDVPVLEKNHSNISILFMCPEDNIQPLVPALSNDKLNLLPCHYTTWALFLLDVLNLFYVGKFSISKRLTMSKTYILIMSLDTVSSIPIEIAILKIAGIIYYSNLNVISSVSLAVLRTLKLVKIWTASSSLSILIDCTKIKYALLQIYYLFLIEIHWLACIYIFETESYYDIYLYTCYREPFCTSWVFYFAFVDNSYITSFYLSALFRTILNVTGANFRVRGTLNTDEYYLATFVTFCGLASSIFMTIQIIILSKYKESHTLTQQFFYNDIKHMFKKRVLPIRTQKEIINYFDFKYQGDYFVEEKIWSSFSDNIATYVKMCIYGERLKSANFCQHFSEDTKNLLVSCAEMEVYLPLAVIKQRGDGVNCIYFIKEGIVAVYDESGCEISHLEDDFCFGDTASDDFNLPNATFVAVSFCILYKIESSSFDSIRKKERLFDRRPASAVDQQTDDMS